MVFFGRQSWLTMVNTGVTTGLSWLIVLTYGDEYDYERLIILDIWFSNHPKGE